MKHVIECQYKYVIRCKLQNNPIQPLVQWIRRGTRERTGQSQGCPFLCPSLVCDTCGEARPVCLPASAVLAEGTRDDMPIRAAKFCLKCSRLAVKGGLCEAHRKDADKQASDRQEHKWMHMYQTATWRAMRSAQLAKEPLCCECTKEHRLTPATVADHTVAHRGDPTLFYDPDNLQSQCASCHSSKTDREDAGFGNPRR